MSSAGSKDLLSSPLQVALRRQQAQEEELGICSPVALSTPEVMAKDEGRADCLFSMEGRSLMPTSGPGYSLPVTGEMFPVFSLSYLTSLMLFTPHV